MAPRSILRLKEHTVLDTRQRRFATGWVSWDLDMTSVRVFINLLVLGLVPGSSYAFFNYPPGTWGPWGPWSNECGCSDTSRYRTRNCVLLTGEVVTDNMQMLFTPGCGNFGMNVGDNMETVTCPECAAIPELETWNAWSECSDPCLGQSFRSRVRRCIYPNDPYGELPPPGSCDGSMYEQQNCDQTCE
ncbi:Thrombospondin type 1 repeat-containing protein [Branchiostoma belcheri]|nr:Thrombospondin type 1 repeat-containing protein [Branchiostoma belcheri]